MARRKQYIIADGTAALPVIAADGSYPAAAGFAFEGGSATLLLAGTVGGGTYALQIQCPDGTWVPVTGIAPTAQGGFNFTAPAGNLRLVVTGSTTPSIKAWVVGIPTNNGG